MGIGADVIFNGIFKGGVLDGFVSAMYLMKPGQSAMTIDGSSSTVIVTSLPVGVRTSVCLTVIFLSIVSFHRELYFKNALVVRNRLIILPGTECIDKH